MRKALSHWESEKEQKRRNQQSRCGGERRGEGLGCGEREMRDEIRDSRRRDWEGRRTTSLRDRNECAVCVTWAIKAARFWVWVWNWWWCFTLGGFFPFRFLAITYHLFFCC